MFILVLFFGVFENELIYFNRIIVIILFIRLKFIGV